MKYTIKSESNRKRASILWEKHEHQFPRFSPTMSFFAFSRTMRNWWGNPCISHMTKYAIGWNLMGKKHPYYGKSTSINFPDFPIPWVLLHFPVLWEIYEETHALPIWWHRLIFSCVIFQISFWEKIMDINFSKNNLLSVIEFIFNLS